MENCKGSEKYEAVTVWNGEDGYIVTVRTKGFSSHEEARSFACGEGERCVSNLKLTDDGCLVLMLNTSETIPLLDADVAVSRLMNTGDEKPLQVPIARFPSIAGLCRNYESIAYGVRRNGIPCPV